MPDITELILDDHEWFRRQFAALDDVQAGVPLDTDAVQEVWEPLAARLDVHAIAEEEIFYPQLLAHGEDPEDETLDAIGDHNDIRDGVGAANEHAVGSEEWWAGVSAAREANDEHMGEEEHEGLADFRQHVSLDVRHSIAVAFVAFEARHVDGVPSVDKDPDDYVRDNS